MLIGNDKWKWLLVITFLTHANAKKVFIWCDPCTCGAPLFSCTLQGLSAGRLHEQQKWSHDIWNLPCVLIKLVLIKIFTFSWESQCCASGSHAVPGSLRNRALWVSLSNTVWKKNLDQCPNKTKSVPTTHSAAATKSLYSTFWTAASASSQEFRSGVEARWAARRPLVSCLLLN